MAATFEAMVALNPDRYNSKPAAFVAAHAYHLLHLAKERTTQESNPHLLTATAVAPALAALVLFLIADQPSDAAEMARRIEPLIPETAIGTNLLVKAICFLGLGQIQRLSELSFGDQISEQNDIDAATEALYLHIGKALTTYSGYLSAHERTTDSLANASGELQRVQNLSRGSPQTTSTLGPILDRTILAFPGPHHLSVLLTTAIQSLSKLSILHLEVPTGLPETSWRELISPIATERPYLWPNHLEALSAGLLERGVSAAISFPTGAGKTTLSALKVAASLAGGQSVIYLAPTNALVSQVKRDLGKVFPGVEVRESLILDDFYAEVDDQLVTGIPHVAVMTPERCLSLLSATGKPLNTLGLVVFDECHLIHPGQAGRMRRNIDAILAVLFLHRACPSADWLMLSAMMANASEMANWLADATGRKCLALTLNWKPTRQARGCLVYNMEHLTNLKAKLRRASLIATRDGSSLGAPNREVRQLASAVPSIFMGLQQTWQDRKLQNYALLELMKDPIPLGVSKGQRSWYPTANKNIVAAHIASKCADVGLSVLAFAQSLVNVGAIAKQVNALFGSDDPVTLIDPERRLLKLAIEELGSEEGVIRPTGRAGTHHSLLLPVERELIELVFRRKGSGVQVLAATPTLAQGINLPADVVLIVGDQRFEDEAEGFTPLDPHELLNAAGRAGRAGLVAQGVVIVIPHGLVGFNAASREIGNDWMRLQQTVFSKSDQCLSLADPIGTLLDRIQDVSQDDDTEITYFLRRLPRADDEGSEETRKFLRSSLAGWHARNAGRTAEFELQIDAAIQKQHEAEHQDTDEWFRDLAYRTGISPDFIVALDNALSNDEERLPITIEDWIRWFFSWLGRKHEVVEELFAHRLSKKQREELDLPDFFGGNLAEAVVGWTNGLPLNKLDPLLGGNPKKPGECKFARKFVLRLLPDLAFAAGLVTQIRRGQIDRKGGSMTTTLAVLGLCIREGASTPELAALRIVASSAGHRLSRMGNVALWNDVSQFVPKAKSSAEPFSITLSRIRLGFDAFDAFS